MNFLFLDLETTGYAGDARCIEIAWILASQDKTIRREHRYLIKPEGWIMPKKEFWLNNGFNQEKSLAEGTPIAEAIALLKTSAVEASVIVAHNISYDLRILNYELSLLGMGMSSSKATYCTMMETIKFCGLRDKNGKPKRPSLTELHHALFECGFDGAHGAMADTQALMKCFFELLSIGVAKQSVYAV